MKKSNRKRLVYFRYIMPIIMVISLIVLMFIPCYRYITADTGIKGAVSLWTLLGNSWDTAREYIFGSGEKIDVTLDFARALFATVIVLWTLFALGVLSVIYSTVTALKYFIRNCENDSKSRILYVTLTVNRVVLCIYHALMLPIFLLPKIMPYLYKNILNYHIELHTQPFDMLWIAIAIFTITVVMTIVSKRSEMLCDMNIYSLSEEASDEDSEHTEEYESPDNRYESMSEMAKAEQLERIKRLLNKQDDGEDDQ